MSPTRLVALMASLTLVVTAACGAGSPGPSATPLASTTGENPTASRGAPSSQPRSGQPSAGPSATASAASAPTLTQPWATATLTDVTTGDAFRIADLATGGRTVFVEAMAIWCSNCRRQQGEFTTALARLDPSKVAYVVLTVDPSESAGALADYRAARGFSGTYAVAGREVSAALEADFGPTVLSPPNVPVVVISPTGSVAYQTGQHSADEIVAIVDG